MALRRVALLALCLPGLLSAAPGVRTGSASWAGIGPRFSLPFENRRVPVPDGRHYLVVWWRQSEAQRAAGERSRLTFRVVESLGAGVPESARDGMDSSPEPGAAIAVRKGDRVVAEGSLDHGPDQLLCDRGGFTFFEERGRIGKGVLAQRFLLDGTPVHRVDCEALSFTPLQWDGFDETSSGIHWFDVVWAEPGGDLVALAHCGVAQRIDARTGRVTVQPAAEVYGSGMLHGDEATRRRVFERIAIDGVEGYEAHARRVWEDPKSAPVERLAAAAVLTRAGERTGRWLAIRCALDAETEAQRAAMGLARRLLPVWTGPRALAWYQHLLLPGLFPRPDREDFQPVRAPFPSLDGQRPAYYCSSADPVFDGLVALGADARPFLEYLLGHQDPAGYSFRAARALRRLGDPAAGPALRRAFVDPGSTAWREEFGVALLELAPDDPEVVTAMWAWLDDVATFGAPAPIVPLWQPRWLRFAAWAEAHPVPQGARVLRAMRERVPQGKDAYRDVREALARAHAAQPR